MRENHPLKIGSWLIEKCYIFVIGLSKINFIDSCNATSREVFLNLFKEMPNDAIKNVRYKNNKIYYTEQPKIFNKLLLKYSEEKNINKVTKGSICKSKFRNKNIYLATTQPIPSKYSNLK